MNEVLQNELHDNKNIFLINASFTEACDNVPYLPFSFS